MRRAMQVVAAAGASMMLAVAVQAQTPRHEFGVDMAIASIKRDGSDRYLRVAAPIDVRIGFLTASPLMFETRFGFEYLRADEGSVMQLAPGINALWRLGPGTGLANQMGPYITGGVTLEYYRESFEGGSDSAKQFGANVGIGTRLGWGPAAFRPELVFQKSFESGNQTDGDFVPGLTAIGVRLGVSLWR